MKHSCSVVLAMVDFTVVIPTYNGAQRLPKVLDALRSQTNVDALQWEILVVDNNSSDNTKDVVEQYYQKDWIKCLLRYVFEPQQGLAFARQCALKNGKGELLGFIDDDIVPSPDWLMRAFRFSHTHPQAGAYGGQIHGEYEIEPPANFNRIQSFLAIREGGHEPRQYKPESLSLPPGASLVVRRQAWLDCVPDAPVLSGRLNNSLIAGEDYEVLLYMYRAGWEIWYNPLMHVDHQIPQHRLEPSYLFKLSKGCGLCIYALRQLLADTIWQRLIIAVRVSLGGLRRALLHIVKYQRVVFTDWVVRCELIFFLSTAVSPLYVFWSYLQRKPISSS